MMKNLAFTFGALVFSTILFAQTPNEGLGNEVITVVREYDPSLSQAFKVPRNPLMNDTVAMDLKLDYRHIPVVMDVKFEAEPMSAARIARTVTEPLYRNTVKLGMGTYISPNFEFTHTNERSASFNLGARARWFSSTGRIDDRAFSGFNESGVSLWGDRFYKDITLSARAFYEGERRHYYHQDQPTDADADSIRQQFSTVGMSVALVNPSIRPARVYRRSGLSYYHWTDSYNASEDHLKFDLGLGFLVQEEQVDMDFKLDFNRAFMPSDTSSSVLMELAPVVRSKWGALHFNLGFRPQALIDMRETTTTTDFRLFPVADVTFRIVDQVLLAYAGLDGGIHQNTLRDLTREAPFLNTDVSAYSGDSLSATIERIRLYGGIKGTLSYQSSFNLYARYRAFKDHVFFYVPSTEAVTVDTTRLQVVYDNASALELGGELIYFFADKFELGVAGQLNFYATDSLRAPWHIPASELNAHLRYDLGSKIGLELQWFHFGQRTVGITADGRERSLPAYNDIQLGAQYNYSKRLSAYLNIRNLLNQSYDLWDGYRAQGINVHFGFKYVF